MALKHKLPDAKGTFRFDPKTMALHIDAHLQNGKIVRTDYVLEVLHDAQFGRPAFRLHKIGDDGEVVEVYDQGKDHGQYDCDCQDKINRPYRECKHIRTVKALVKHGLVDLVGAVK